MTGEPGGSMADISAQQDPHRKTDVTNWRADAPGREADARTIPAEVPVSLVYKGFSHVVMMASPVDLEDFGLGFSLSEGVIASVDDMNAIDVLGDERGFIVSMDIPDEAYRRIAKRRRYLSGRTGCGLCGVESLEGAVPELEKLGSEGGLKISPDAIYDAFENLHPHQPEKLATGAVHGAAWCAPDGGILCVREDVGRHNALDKLIGAMARDGADFTNGFCLITSRCSYEMVQKAVQVKMPVLAAISAPTTLALDMAEDSGLTLLAMVREKTFTAFAHAHRIEDA